MVHYFDGSWSNVITNSDWQYKLFHTCVLLLSVVELSDCFVDTCGGQQRSTPTVSTLSTTPPSGGPKLPDLPSQFKTNLEINIVDKNLTVDAVEYYDYYGNRVRLDTMREGYPGTALYDFANNEAIYISLGACMVFKLTSRAEVMAIFGNQKDNGLPHVMDSNYVLKFGSKYGETYMGQDTVRGITVEHWQACVFWSQYNRSYTVDYYFSAPGEWSTSSGFVSVPVRAEARGSGIHHIYDYYSFITGLGDSPSTVFETPKGVICKGRKNQKMLPALPNQFYYRQEIIYELPGLVTTTDIWYDDAAKLIRVDYRPLAPGEPTFTTNYLTEIHDFNTGVRYIKDNVLGNCSIYPLLNSSYGGTENIAAMKNNGSYQLHIKNPLQIFYLNNNYTYVGKRPCRGMTCSVFSAIVTNYVVEGAGSNNNATVEFYFLSDEFENYPNDGNSATRNVPVMMDINIPGIGYHQTSNIMDFDGNHPKMSVFDVSACYQETEKLHFKVRFIGKFQPVLTEAFEFQAHQKLQEAMGVTPLRIQNLRLDYDLADLYLYATLLRDTPSTVQFTYIGKKEIEHQDDAVIGNIMLAVQCAEMCTTNPGFVCNSFDFCPGDISGSCRLSKAHIGDGKSRLITSGCDHFSRNVDGSQSEKLTLTDTYEAFQRAVYSKQFTVPVYIDNNVVGVYDAVDTFVTFGWLQPFKMPDIGLQFSYHQEVVIPSQLVVFDSKVWYDSTFKLTRYDYRASKAEAPYYSTNPMTVIHDFNNGIQYVIDRFYQNCTISQVLPSSYDSELNMQAMIQDKSYIIQMKNPLDYFHITKDVRFIGQRNVRGMETNVYESVVKQFTMPGFPGSYTAVLQFFFLINTWSDSGVDSGQSTADQPVKMDVIIVEKSLYLTYNYYDFEAAHPDLSLFDTKLCFSYKDQRHFQLTFPGPFHPYLDLYRRVFELETQEVLSGISGASILRFTDTTVDYDNNNVYVTSTLLEKPPYLLDFTKIPGKVSAHADDVTFVTLSSPSDCANVCLSQQKFPCYSFDYCADTQACHLSKEHIQDGILLDNNTSCDHYSRTVNSSTLPSPNLWTAYANLKNAVYLHKLQVRIPTVNNTVKTYTATLIKDTMPKPKELQGGKILNLHFTMYQSNIKMSSSSVLIDSGLAVDDCAEACLMEELFGCESFDYCYNDGTCYLSGLHPELNQTLIQPQQYCSLFGRKYLDSFKAYPGLTLPNKGKLISTSTALSPNLCAQQCATSTGCRSFDYCDNDQSCYLHSTHILDGIYSTTVKSPSCTHYSRDYLPDFRFVANKVVPVGISILYYDLSADQCAKMCVDIESVDCKSFSYCPNVTQCILRTGNPKDAPPGSALHNEYCDLYIRRPVPGSLLPPPRKNSTCNHFIPPPHPTKSNRSNTKTTLVPGKPSTQKTIHLPSQTIIPQQTSTSSSDITGRNTRKTSQTCNLHSAQSSKTKSNNTAAYVGIAIGMLALGVVIGAALTFLIRRNEQKSDDMNLKLMN